MFRRMFINYEIVRDLSVKVHPILYPKMNEATTNSSTLNNLKMNGSLLFPKTQDEDSVDVKVKFELDSPSAKTRNQSKSEMFGSQTVTPTNNTPSKAPKKRKLLIKMEASEESEDQNLSKFVEDIQDTKLSIPQKSRKRRRHSKETTPQLEESTPSSKRKKK